MHTLILVNPNAGGGRALRVWQRIQAYATRALDADQVKVTRYMTVLPEVLERAHKRGIRRIIGVGGDGTNAAILNCLMRRPDHGRDFTYGMLPLGTGRDFARSLKMPFDPMQAIHWLANAQPQRVDIGAADIDGVREYFLNVGGVGIDGDVGRRIDRSVARHPWTFYQRTIEAILFFRPPDLTVTVDGAPFWAGASYMAAVANGEFFGHNMNIAPGAHVDDGMFQVVIVEGMPRLRLLRAFGSVYRGQHVGRRDVHVRAGKSIQITAQNGAALPIQLDGEVRSGCKLVLTVLPRALNLLMSARR